MSNAPDPEACYRHGRQETYIHCQRCERPICIECQTPGAVGVLCPECVHPGGKPRTRRRFSLRVSGTQTPVVTYTLIAITFAVYALQWIPGLGITDSFLYAPVYTFGGNELGAPYEPWRMVSSIFLHSTGLILHVLLNMYTLFVFGQVLETMLGRGRFLSLYLISGFGGSVAVMYLATPQTGVVGASGAIFGLLGAFLVIQRKLGGDSTQLLVLLGINLVIGFLPGMSISWQAHVGGLVTGLLIGLIFANTRNRRQFSTQVALTSGLALVLVGAVLIHAPGVLG